MEQEQSDSLLRPSKKTAVPESGDGSEITAVQGAAQTFTDNSDAEWFTEHL